MGESEKAVALKLYPSAQYIVDLMPIDERREVCIIPLTFGRARVAVGPPGGQFIDQFW